MIIHRNNLRVLSQLRPGQILTCDSVGTIRINIGAGATWHSPPANLLESITASFEHYLRLFEIVTESELLSQSYETYPNLYVSLSGLTTLIKTYNKYNMNQSVIDDSIGLYTKLRNRLDLIKEKHPNFFEQKIEAPITIEECETALKDIEQNLNAIIAQPDHPDADKAQKLKQYIVVLKETVQNCYQTLTEKAVNLFSYIVKFFMSLTQKDDTQNDLMVKRTFVSEELVKKIRDIDFDNDKDYIKVDIDEPETKIVS